MLTSYEPTDTSPAAVRAWLRDASRMGFELHHSLMSLWYGPDGIKPSDVDRRLVGLIGEAASKLQTAFHLVPDAEMAAEPAGGGNVY